MKRTYLKELKESGSYLALGIEMGASVAIGYFLGLFLDRVLWKRHIFVYIFLVAGIAAAFKALYREAKRYLHEQENDKKRDIDKDV